jgi:hypothetical protein
MNKRSLLFLTILIEGYVVLAVELLAMRSLIPFVGSGTEVIALVISAVLLPLAIGYHRGGSCYERRYQEYKTTGGKKPLPSIRRILLQNLLTSLIILSAGLSYVIQEIFFGLQEMVGIQHHILQTSLFCLTFLVYPVYLLAQTIPLLSNFFSSEHLSHITGRMLFFSTVGSFGGSVLSTLVLMTTIGVHSTLLVTLFLLVAMIFLLTRKWYEADNAIAIIWFGLAVALNAEPVMQSLFVVADTQYSLIKVHHGTVDMETGLKNWKMISINRSTSSAYTQEGERPPYIEYIEQNLLDLPPMDSVVGKELADIEHYTTPPLRVLVIGAGGFTLGMRDIQNHYTFVDIDPAVKTASEQYFLPKPLGKNKEFYALSARAFLRQNHEQYDVIVLDLYSNIMSIPQEAVTQDFFRAVKTHLKQGGVVAANAISSPDFRDKFSVRYYNSFASVFPHCSRQIIQKFHSWNNTRKRVNALYLYFDRPDITDTTIYTDDLNPSSLDK